MHRRRPFVPGYQRILQTWQREQYEMKTKLSLEDDDSVVEKLRNGSILIGGLDIAHVKDDATVAFAALYVLRLSQPVGSRIMTSFVDSLCIQVELTQPYIATYLAFREVPAYAEVVHTYLDSRPPDRHPDVYVIDANGTLHPRGFGAACHLGVALNKPTIGIAKKLLYIANHERQYPVAPQADGSLRLPMCMELIEEEAKRLPVLGSIDVVNRDGDTCGLAMRSVLRCRLPIYVSPGHRTTLETARQIASRTAKYRIPEPTRQADLLARRFVKQYEEDLVCDRIARMAI